MKVKTQYSCQSCGYTSAKWLGKCPGCEAWNSLVEERTGGNPETQSAIREDFKSFRTKSDQEDALETVGLHGALSTGRSWVLLDDSDKDGISKVETRLSTGISELDRVLGGGMIPDSFTLVGGDPGIGKSTLL